MPAPIDEELAGAGAHVADRPRERQRRVAEPRPERLAHRRRRRLLQDLLVAALDRAVALAERDARAVLVEQDLDLDVSCADDQPLEDQPVVTEGGSRLATGRRDRVGQRLPATDGPHPLAATTGRGLDQERKADALRRREERGIGLVRVVVAGQDRDPERGRQAPGRGLVAHRPDRGRRRPDPADPGGDDRLGEVGVLGEEPETGVDRVGAGVTGRRDHRVDVEQVEPVGTVRVGHDRADAEPKAGPGDAAGDLAAVGDEDGADRGDRGVGNGALGSARSEAFPP